MSDYKRVPTSAEVWAVIRARHPEMRVFGSYSAPDGDQFGDPSKGKMFTSYGFEHGDYPVIEAQTTWDIDPEARHKRINEQHEYWLCLPVREDAYHCSDQWPGYRRTLQRGLSPGHLVQYSVR